MISWNSRPVSSLPGGPPAIRLWDSASDALRNIPHETEQGLYVCGITPYDATHMGHAATYVAFDLLNRLWRDAGSTVNYVQNVTDVDDPLLERADATNVDWMELAESQTDLFRTDMEALNVLAPEHYVGAVESIELIVPVVESLLERNLAYRVEGSGSEPDGDVYFSVESASELTAEAGEDAWKPGFISHLQADELAPIFAERGGDPDRPGKRNPLDPLLWRVARDGEPSWEGRSLGAGRPGWHIECSVIALEHLPAPFTVQGGGSDLMFPHHEMSSGHAQVISGAPLARHYAHAGMVGLDGEKMSKSRGNLVLVSALREAGTDPAAIRLAILANHYRSDWSWTSAGLADARVRLDAWRSALSTATVQSVTELMGSIRTALADDLDAPSALAAVDRWTVDTAHHTGSDEGAALAADVFDALLGVRLKD
ncbi:cysteine--1-D-myo-inosityl 2-amino-2-deoxy-alpha-D-glucopyranoside ligase [Arthrobacter sp. JZ12]|uniref:cysteine--1-D-myo-inosityl 2-amino-2-deoxy-alpha-D-glucopyranoside ligase n=1 Tax=Arthrobacter sp. JZ12 TaxID=2654190 RepID=UPI002B49CEA0|nr:cysteine--1-D-myo-inosityl 2-amino-2-deoxy-alpha-D-glucopyranoside ligase [Arthrobacter sp. JZ12]WRH24952.1 cysteine--1-D-myo-inosityl 2-amino-2-deoxy-alpha-D-glucopyranoside ligase [Arthrobacter sp. JZ12]